MWALHKRMGDRTVKNQRAWIAGKKTQVFSEIWKEILRKSFYCTIHRCSLEQETYSCIYICHLSSDFWKDFNVFSIFCISKTIMAWCELKHVRRHLRTFPDLRICIFPSSLQLIQSKISTIFNITCKKKTVREPLRLLSKHNLSSGVLMTKMW